jgi:hypothetical protein
MFECQPRVNERSDNQISLDILERKHAIVLFDEMNLQTNTTCEQVLVKNRQNDHTSCSYALLGLLMSADPPGTPATTSNERVISSRS